MEEGPDADAVDAGNLSWLMTSLDRYGWPEGDIDSQNAWILCQHGDLSAVRRCLELGQGIADPQHIALLTDTERALAGQPQVYGTRVKLVEGVVRPCPIEGDVDARRAEVGWPPLSEYLAQFEAPGRVVSTEPWPACPLE